MGAERPLFFVGGGVVTSGAGDTVKELAEHLDSPVTWTLMGKGAFPEDHPLNTGMIGMHGTRAANYAMSECDLIFAVGVRFDDRATGRLDRFAPHATIVHVDIDPAEIGKIVKTAVPIVGDAFSVTEQILKAVQAEEKEPADKSTWLAKVQEWKTRYPLEPPALPGVRPQAVVAEISRQTVQRDTIVTTGVGQNQMWAAQFFRPTQPRSFISSGGLGTMGFGLPSAIGAQVARPEATVIDIDGDGSFQMVLQDLGTIIRYGLPVKAVILNNSYLGMVRQWQELFYDRRYMAVDLERGTPDFVKLAEAYGIKGIRVEDEGEISGAIEMMLGHDGPVVLDVKVEKEENVFPMVPSGAALDEVMGGEER